jgi:hypothetical protein
MSVSEQQFSMFRISSDKHKIIWISCVLVSIIVAVYFQVVHHQFLNLDDDAYVTGNPRVISGISGTNIIWAFSAFDYIYWQPVTWLSHMFDVQFFGMNPGGHHLTNVLIHAVSSVLLLLLLVRLSGAIWQSSFVAFMFALHPLHVESVAWVAERKDVLSALFWILTLMAYAEFSERRKPFLYVSTLVFFLLGLMSKPMVLTLPVVMLLIDFWPLSSCGKGSADTLQQRMMSLIIEKIPFIACSLLSVAITIFGHDRYGGVRTLREMPLQLRIENALTAYIKYRENGLANRSCCSLSFSCFNPALAGSRLVAAAGHHLCDGSVCFPSLSLRCHGLVLVPHFSFACYRSGAGGKPIYGRSFHVYPWNRTICHCSMGDS